MGVTSFDFPKYSEKIRTSGGLEEALFVTWAFTRNPKHCTLLMNKRGEGSDDAVGGGGGVVDGCTVVLDEHVSRDGYVTTLSRAPPIHFVFG